MAAQKRFPFDYMPVHFSRPAVDGKANGNYSGTGMSGRNGRSNGNGKPDGNSISDGSSNSDIRSDYLAQRDEVILEHMPQVNYIAGKLMSKLPYSVEYNDLVGAGTLGLLDACDKYDPLREVKFKTYAELRIKGAMLDSLRNLDFLPRSTRKNIKDVESAYRILEKDLPKDEIYQRLAEKLGWKNQELRDFLDMYPINPEGIYKGSFIELDASENEEHHKKIHEALTIDGREIIEDAIERREIWNRLEFCIDQLPPRERLVVDLYYYDELTMKKIGKVLGVGESSISQLHTRAMIRLRGYMKSLV